MEGNIVDLLFTSNLYSNIEPIVNLQKGWWRLED